MFFSLLLDLLSDVWTKGLQSVVKASLGLAKSEPLSVSLGF